MANLSVRMNKEILDELDRIAKLQEVDRATIVRRIIDRGIKKQRIDLALDLYQKGESLERAANISGASLWDVLEQRKRRGITSKFDIEEEKDTIIRIFAKEDEELEKKIRML